MNFGSKLMEVRNVMTNAVVTVRRVDLFKILDNDGVGYEQGQLIVDCDDELINQPGHSKNILVSAIDRV